MKLKELVNKLEIDVRKLTDYALKRNSPKGADKAVMFMKHLGYTANNYQFLLDQIYAKALEQEAIFHSRDEFGERYNIDLQVRGIETGQLETVRIGWIIASNSDTARLITIYIRKRS